ncbi:uncharacterized protein LOC123704883 [Colias croceus]|uniref:uncharacterized protein LOC123704876 n=1 Tax=Colias crocea TaxID=72248 RepID=UPI001E27CDCA|nr:uncharacterized protein LOC123704876 [Colias croceus]XP_045509334.1 uncharacterized protein LOC123704883 [Colias croceus]
MAAVLNRRLPQEGTSICDPRESLPELSSSGCPTYSGGGASFRASIPLGVKKTNHLSANCSTLLSVDFCNIRGLNSNLEAVHHHLETAKPALLFLTETQISSPADTSYLNYPGYVLEHTFVPRAGVCVYAREDICCRRLGNLEGIDLSLLWLRVDCDNQPRVYACLYRSHSGNTETDRLIEKIQTSIDILLQKIPTIEIVVLGDFNAHHAEWLCSRNTDHAGRSFRDFALAYDLTQLVPSPTRIPDVEDHTPSLLDLFLTSSPDNYKVSVAAPLGSSDHCLIQSTVPLTYQFRSRPATTRRVWHYGSADWDGMRTFFSSYPWRQVCFADEDPDACADCVADVVLQGMELFIPNSVVPVGGKSQPWFGQSCREASRTKPDRYRNWAEALAAEDPEAKHLKKLYNSASRSLKRKIAEAKSSFINRIGKKLTH